MASDVRSITIGDIALELRPPVESDVEGMLSFARALPPRDLLFLPTDITREENVETLIGESLRGQSYSTLALEGSDVVGYSTIAPNGVTWMRHVAELRVIVAERIRRAGLGRLLTIEAVRTAVDVGVEKIVAQMTIEQDDAIKMFRRIGFQSEAVLRDHVKDRDGELHDLVVMSHHTAQLLSRFGLRVTESGYVSTSPPTPRLDDP